MPWARNPSSPPTPSGRSASTGAPACRASVRWVPRGGPPRGGGGDEEAAFAAGGRRRPRRPPPGRSTSRASSRRADPHAAHARPHQLTRGASRTPAATSWCGPQWRVAISSSPTTPSPSRRSRGGRPQPFGGRGRAGLHHPARKWASKIGIQRALVQNPQTPIALALRARAQASRSATCATSPGPEHPRRGSNLAPVYRQRR